MVDKKSAAAGAVGAAAGAVVAGPAGMALGAAAGYGAAEAVKRLGKDSDDNSSDE